MADPAIAPPRSWGRSTVQTACPLDCPDACSLSVTVERGQITNIDGNRLARSTDGYICGKVRRFDRRVYSDERLMYPAVRTGPKGRGQFERVTWDEALDLIATRMREAADQFGAESVLPYHYGGSNGLLTNGLEDARLFRQFGVTAGSPCAPFGAAAGDACKMGVAYEDYARLPVVWGANPSVTGIIVSHIKAAQKAGAKLVRPTRAYASRIADCISA
jgi:anaerobic selenocysteine-containing dehydrogenase